MTKIKNTKKGMAKKTLSMSLVVAMLATSNVPVWAAEFSDGTDTAVTSEAEAPAVDDIYIAVFRNSFIEIPDFSHFRKFVFLNILLFNQFFK